MGNLIEGDFMKGKKNILGVVFIIAIVITACAQKYNAESDFKAIPREDGKSVIITEYVGTVWTVSIPPKIKNLPVTEIGEGAFQDKKLINVIIPNGITRIDSFAFNRNLLSTITIPNSVVFIGKAAFGNNNIEKIIIGRNVDTDSFDWFFDAYYKSTCKKAAGIYILNEDAIKKAGGLAIVDDDGTIEYTNGTSGNIKDYWSSSPK